MVEQRSKTFDEYMLQHHYLTYSNIEIRPLGIILHIHKKLENYAWVLPFGTFSFRRINDNLRIEAEQEFVELRDAFVFNEAFIQKLILQAERQ